MFLRALLLTITCLSFQLDAQELQTKSIKGIITSNKKPLYDVSVVLNGTKYFAITDKHGKFEIDVPKYLWDEEIFIIFRCKGYEDNLVQFLAEDHFHKKLKVEMKDKFESAIENYINPDTAVIEFNNIIRSKDVSKEENPSNE